MTREDQGLLHAHCGLPAHQRILLFQGGLLANRNLEVLVRAMAHVRAADCILVFLGNGPLRQPLEALARQAGVAHRVRFVPAVAPDDLLAWTASADLGIIPYGSVDLNTHFCTPNKLFEYIQAALPILANDLPELRRFVRDTGFGRTVPMHGTRLLAAAIDDLLAERHLLETARQLLLQRRHEFSWQHASRDYVRILNTLVPPTPPRESSAPTEVCGHVALET